MSLQYDYYMKQSKDKENIRRIYKDGFLDITKLEELPKNMAQLVKQHLK